MESQLGELEQAEASSMAQELKNSGNDKFNKNNYKGAIVDYTKGLLHEPNNSDLHANLSAAYLHLEKYIEAEEHAVYAIQLKPNFYKGYMRAAKAAHGKGMTRLALKRLNAGLNMVIDPNGVKELTRLKNQYTAYLSLQSNVEREMAFESDTYQSEDEDDEEPSSEDDDDDDDPPPPPDHPPFQEVPYLLCGMNMCKEENNELPVLELHEPLKPTLDVNTETKEPTPPAKKEERKTKGPEKCDEPQEMKTDQPESKQNETPYSETSEKRIEHPFDRIRELTRHPELKKRIAEFKEHLKIGGEAFLGGNYRKAAESYKAAKERVGQRYLDFEIDERQYHVIKYAYCAALININTYDDIIKAIQGLNEMKTYEFSIPAIYIQMARAYYKLNRFKTALEPLGKLQEILDNCPIFPTFTWPGTNETIEETTPNGLKNSIKELNQLCRMPHKPTATCRFDGCLKTSSHILPSDLIYASDPDFIGFVRMICEEKCHIEFHISCWRSYKESVSGIGKINDKDFLGRRCLTTDCVNSDGEPSVITAIEIIDSDGQVKSVNRRDHKPSSEQRTAEKKSKKKRSKLDDKEKASKSKKIKEKKLREQKKTIYIAQLEAAAEEEEDLDSQEEKQYIDPVKAKEVRKTFLIDMRKVNYGVNDKNDCNVRLPHYGLSEESVKASKNQFLDQTNGDSVEVRDAKEFLFSYFLTILKDEGPLKLSEVEDLWKESAGDFCDISVVLPNLKSMCELLMESSRFCQLEDYLCLTDQLDQGYQMVGNELAEALIFMMNGRANTESSECEIQPNDREHEDESSGEESESESSSDTDESEEEGSDDEDKDEGEEESDVQNKVSSLPDTEVPKIEPIKPLDDGKFSLQDMLNEMTRVKNIFMKDSEENISLPKTEESDVNKDREESTSNETFETARGSSMNTSTDEIKSCNETDNHVSESSNDDNAEYVFSSDDHFGSAVTVLYNSADQTISGESILMDHDEHFENTTCDGAKTEIKPNEDPEGGAKQSDAQEIFQGSECDKGSQIVVSTEERQIQTAPMETRDRLSQTKESDLYKELNKKVQELSNQIAAVTKENAQLHEDILMGKTLNKTQQNFIICLEEENRKSLEVHKSLQEQMKVEITNKEKEYKKKEEDLTMIMNKMKEMYSSLQAENGQLKKEKSKLLKDNADARQSLTAAMNNIKELESNNKTLEGSTKARLQKALQAQLNIIKAYWENEINQYKKRCVEKISEMQSWFSISPGEVEDLPSYPLIQQHILQWVEVGKKIQEIECEFQIKYNTVESKIAQGTDVEDVTPQMMPALPKEPSPLPLDKIHKEITERHLKKINELTQLVANQQLQIEKSKEQNQLLMNTYTNQMVPRMQTPMTTAFGSLALQYPYPQSVPSQFEQAPVPFLPPPNQDTATGGNAAKLLQADVQTLLQESSKNISALVSVPNTISPGKSVTEESATARGQTPPLSKSYPFPPPSLVSSIPMPPPSLVSSIPMPPLPAMPPVTMTPPPMAPMPQMSVPGLSVPPPPIGVAQNLLKTSTALTEPKKETKLPERSRTPKLEPKVGSSRESTPGPSVPTPEKTKKKKKTKSESKEATETRLAAAASVEAASGQDEITSDDGSGWNVVLPKSAVPKHPTQPSGTLAESKLKNKKKLLEKLQGRFPTTSLKDLDEIVKLVREQNNGSLSGLSFDDIETRVDRVITKRHVLKNSTMGLVKFSNAAWNTVKKPEEIITWTSTQFEECTICLEPMGNERTKVECNHEFHTKCLRKWLKEKSVCPLCNKFTTMPDEFPAL